MLACVLKPDGDFLKFSVTNEGPVAALSVSIDRFTLRYDKSEQHVIATGYDLSQSGRPGFRWMFLPRLEPNQTKAARTGEFIDPFDERWIHALVFDLSYLREADRRSYKSLCTFFRDNGRLITRSEFRSNPQFAKLSAQIERAVARVRASRQPTDKLRETNEGGD